MTGITGQDGACLGCASSEAHAFVNRLCEFYQLFVNVTSMPAGQNKVKQVVDRVIVLDSGKCLRSQLFIGLEGSLN